MIRFENVSVTYNKKCQALKGLDLEVKPGDFLGIIGLSGSGKSSLLKTINGLVESQGEVLVENQAIGRLTKKQLRHKRRSIGFIFQNYNLVEKTSVLENVLMGRLGYKSSLKSFMGLFNKEDYHFALEALDQVGLKDKVFVRGDALSGGQMQRVAIAKVLCQQPSLILADEPVASLDRVSAQNVMEEFKRINEQGRTILINLHDVDLAMKYCNRIIGLKDGHLYFDKKPGEIDDQQLQALYQ